MKKNIFILTVFFTIHPNIFTQYTPPANAGTGNVVIAGELKKWHTVTLTFDGPSCSETATAPNPFMDYRLNVTFTNGTKSYSVPGYFAVDGNAGESSAASGNKWRVHFCPDATGTWSYSASFRIGQNIAISTNAGDGTAVTPINGKTGSINITATDKTGIDLRGKGMLRYVGEHFLQFAENGEYFIKGGPNSPESLLAYDEMDNTPAGYSTNSFNAHDKHWATGDPVWKSTKGKGIIGAINYLASEGMNVLYCLTLSPFGDCKNVFPSTSYDKTAGTYDLFHFDCSKLDQWEIVFSHMDKKGMLNHFVFTETENEALFEVMENTSPFAGSRKLYYREMVARFGHHLAMVWNIGEENGWNDGSTSIYKAGNTDAQRKSFATYIRTLDAYNHPIDVHTLPGSWTSVYTPLLNFSDFEGISGQLEYKGYSMDDTHPRTVEWINKSKTAGKKWFVCIDEPGHDNVPDVSGDDAGVRPDALDATHDIPRKDVLWGNLIGGGQGVEWYSGWNFIPDGGGDGRVDDYSKFNNMWDQTRYALEFFRNYLPYWQMTSKDNLVTNSNWCLAKEGEVYAVYLRNGGTCNLTINTSATYIVKWYDPRNGGALQNGSVTSFSGTGAKALGNAPNNTAKDWVVLVKKDNGSNQIPLAKISATPTSGTTPLIVSFDGSASTDADGSITNYSWDFKDGSPAGSGTKPSHTFSAAGTYIVTMTVSDNLGATATASITIIVSAPANITPIARASTSPVSGTAPLIVSFDASASSDTDGSIVSYSWDFKDGSKSSSKVCTHKYTAAGIYNVLLKVTDNKGASNSTNIVITVSPAPLASDDENNTTIVYPNPVRDQLYFNNTGNIRNVSITSVYGITQKTGQINEMLDVSKLIPGIYLITITMKNGNTCIERIIKE